MTSTLRDSLEWLGSGGDLSAEQSRDAVTEIMAGAADPVAIAAFLTAIRIKGETADVLEGAVQAVRSASIPIAIPPHCHPILDTCGTGGDGANTLNISTAAAIVVASCGVHVLKHGNRSASGNSGSADVLEILGVKVDASTFTLTHCVEEVGIAFAFAPAFHPALRFAAPVRRTLPFRTLFNLIGPLVNPCRPDAQLIGVPDAQRAELIAGALCRLHRETPDLDWPLYKNLVSKGMNHEEVMHALGWSFRAYIVSGEDGTDEVTLSGATHVRPVSSGARGPTQAWRPSDFGLPTVSASSLSVSGPADSAARIRCLVAGERGPARDVVLANAAAALKLVNKVDNLSEGVSLAAEAIDRGDAARLLDRWARLSHSGD